MNVDRRFRNLLSWVCVCCVTLSAGALLVGVSDAQDVERKVIARTAPVYPELAKKMHLSGKVKIEVIVNASGGVASAKVVGGNPVFETSAIDAIKQWKFEPAATSTKGLVVLEFAEPKGQ